MSAKTHRLLPSGQTGEYQYPGNRLESHQSMKDLSESSAKGYWALVSVPISRLSAFAYSDTGLDVWSRAPSPTAEGANGSLGAGRAGRCLAAFSEPTKPAPGRPPSLVAGFPSADSLGERIHS